MPRLIALVILAVLSLCSSNQENMSHNELINTILNDLMEYEASIFGIKNRFGKTNWKIGLVNEFESDTNQLSQILNDELTCESVEFAGQNAQIDIKNNRITTQLISSSEIQGISFRKYARDSMPKYDLDVVLFLSKPYYRCDDSNLYIRCCFFWEGGNTHFLTYKIRKSRHGVEILDRSVFNENNVY